MIKMIIDWFLGTQEVPKIQFKERKPEAPAPGFHEWCKEFRVGILHNKQPYFPD